MENISVYDIAEVLLGWQLNVWLELKHLIDIVMIGTP